MRINSIIEDSTVDGFGIRTTIFVQGCMKKCQGCHNPQTWALQGGELMDIEDIAAIVLRNPLCNGITLSGGEPYLQQLECIRLIKLLKSKKPELNVWIYSGYPFEELLEYPLTQYADVIVDGAYVQEQRIFEMTEFRGSENQRYFTKENDIWRDGLPCT